jgi:hypothetical protein
MVPSMVDAFSLDTHHNDGPSSGDSAPAGHRVVAGLAASAIRSLSMWWSLVLSAFFSWRRLRPASGQAVWPNRRLPEQTTAMALKQFDGARRSEASHSLMSA